METTARPVDLALALGSTTSRPLAIISRHAIAISLALVGLFAAIDHVTGIEATFVMLTYMLPVAIVAWFRSRAAAFVVAACATTCTTWVFVAELATARVSAVLLNAAGALGMFALMIFVLHALRRFVERERKQRRAAVESLRHAERLNVIGTLAAGVAHELGTPLNVISGAAEMLGEGEPPRARIVELSGLILRQTEQITAIIRHLLDFGRRGGVAMAQVDLDRAVANTVDMLAATARKRGVTVAFDGGVGDAHAVRANARELEQVVSNLLINGVQAMPRGGPLHVTTRLELRDGRGYGTVVVADRGAGIRPEHLPYIFDPFFTTKGVGEGHGLGLSVSYGIVSDWGGTIEVASTPGQGATFRVLIPLASG